MIRRLAAASAVVLLALLLIAPAASAQVEGPYTGVAPGVEERPRVTQPEPARVVVTRPADVTRREALAATGIDAGIALAVTGLLIGSGAVILLATRRRSDAPA